MKKVFYFILAVVCGIIGVIGAIFPIIPGTPFIIFSVICFTKSSKFIAKILMKNKHIRAYMENYQTNIGVPISTKIFSLSISTISFVISMIFAKVWWLYVLLCAIYLTILIKVLKIKTLKTN